jgi:predicted dehydrogenase
MTARVAVLGCGYWGKNLVRNFHELGALEMVCDELPEGRAQAQKIAPGAQVVASADSVFASRVQGVVIATPAETHYELCRRALDAGKDVFVEKPMALRLEHATDLVERARAAKRVILVGHVLEYHPAIVRVKELIAEGQLGRVNYIYSNRLNLGKIRREENILWSFAPHDIAVITRLVGDMPFEVVACGGAYIQPNIADVTLTHLLFDNGVRAHIFVSWLHPFKEQRLVVIGSKSMVSYDDVTKKLILHDQRVEIRDNQPQPFKGEGTEIAFADTEPLRLEC